MTRTAAAYLRMSTEQQRYSLISQRASLERYASEHDLKIVSTYMDPGKSGLSLKGRLGLQALLKEARANELNVDALLVLDVSRWGRFQDTDEGAYYEFEMRRAGIEVIYCDEPFENDGSPTATIFKSIKRAMAAEYSRELSKKISAGMKLAAGKGFRTGSSAGYGLRRAVLNTDGHPGLVLERGQWKSIKNDRIVLVPGPLVEADAIRRMFALFVKGRLQGQAIAQILKDEGWPAPSPLGWSGKLISKLIRNEKYAGALVFGRTRRELSKGRFNVERSSWIRVEGAYEPTISCDTFHAAQVLIASRVRSFTDDEILDGLSRLQHRYGYVTRKLIFARPELPSVAAIRRRFGSLAIALKLAGCPTQSASVKKALVRAGQPVKPQIW